MKDTIKKYQTGGVVQQNPDVALANNQQNVLSEEELKFLTDKYGSNAQFNIADDQSTTNSDTTVTDEELKFLKQKYGDNFQATVVSDKPQKTPNTISNTPISENPFEEFLGDADQSLTYKPENDPVRQKNINDLVGSGVIIPRDVNPNHIKFEDVGSHAMRMPMMPGRFDEIDYEAQASNLKKATLPNGEEYIFAPEGKTTGQDKLYDTGQYLAQGAVSGFASGLEFVNQVLWKFSGAEFIHNAVALATDNKTTDELGITDSTKGIFYTPFTNQIRDGINKGTIKINPSDSYLATQKALDDKIKAGDVEGLLTDPLFWKSKFNDESFHREFLPGASSAVEFMTPGIGVNKLNLGTRLVDKMGDVGIIQKLDASDKIKAAWGIAGKAGDVGTSAFLMGSMEAHMEGENNAEAIALEKYNSLIPEDSGILPVRSIEELEAAPDDELKKQALETYDEAYSNIFRANQVPLILSNVIPMAIIKGGGTIFKQVPGALGRLAQKFPKAAATFELTTSGLSEMGQETYQSGVGNYERDKLINGLYPLDNNAIDDIIGSAQRAWKDFNVDPETTSAGVLGFMLNNSTVAPMEIANAYDQIKANKDTRKLLESYPTGNFHSIRNLFTKEGTVNTEELAKTVNSINQTIVNQKFVDEAAQMNDQELMDYAYQQSIAPIVYEAMEKGIDESTVKNQIRELISSTLPKDKSFVDAEGNITKPSQLLDKRVEQVDWLMRAHAKATKIATKENLPEKVKQSLFSAIVGYNNFDRLTEKLAGEIRTVEGEIKATKEKLKRNQLLINDFNKEDANDILSGAILEGSVNDALDPTDASVKELNDLFDRYIDSAKVANDYNRIINKLLKKETVAEQRRLDRAVRIKDISSRKLKSERHKNTPVEIAPEVITNEIVRENPGVNKQDVEAEVRAEQTKLLKAKEQELKESLPALAREPGASYDALVNPKGEEIQEGEKSLRRNILNSELAKQKKEADEVPLENRYENRALLQEQETITLTQTLESATSEELSAIIDRFVELSNLPPTAVSAMGSFLNAPAAERMKDPLYAQSVREAYLDIPNNGDPFNQDLSGFDILNTTPLDPKLQGDQLENQKQEDLTKEDNTVATETNLPEESEITKVTPDIPETERERRNRNMINVFHKKIGDMNPEKVPLSYTPTFEEWFKGISYLHLGLLSPGDRIYLEIDPKVEHNRFANPGWRNLSVQAVTYTSTGERVVVGMLASYREQGQYPTATPELETLRNKLYDQWANRTSQEEVIKTGYETAVQEIYKGHIEQITAAPGTQEQVLPSTHKALVDGKVNMNDVEIGMKTGLQKEQVPVSTNNVSFKMEQDANTKDDATRTGWIAVLIKSHKIYKSKNYHYETFRVYTRKIKDVKGYREAILQGLRDNKIADVQMLVSFNEKVEGGPPIRGPRWEYSKQDQNINNRPIPANTPYIVLGRQVIVGAEDIYKELDLGNKAVNIDQAWLENYESKPKVPHPIYGKRDIKDIILKELTLSGLDASTINSYAFGENTKESLFHSGKFSVEPWSKPEVGPQGGVIRDVKAPETGATVRRRVQRGKLKVQDSTLSFNQAPNIVWEDNAKAEQWFKERLAEIGYNEVSPDALRKLANLPRLSETAKVWGMAQDAAVTLAKDRPEGTTRHEAFHIVFNLFLTDTQREKAYRELWNKVQDPKHTSYEKFKNYSKEEFETALKVELFGNQTQPKFSLGKNVKTVYQGRRGSNDNREVNYFTVDIEEARSYGNVSEVQVDTTDFLDGSSDEFYKIKREYRDLTGINFDILDNSVEGLKNQNKFFNFLKTKGYKGLDFTKFSDTRYIVSFSNSSIIPKQEKPSIPRDSKINYVLKSAEILNSQKAIDWFKKRDKAQWKDDLFYTKLSSELGIPKDQVEILKSLNLSNPYNREELLSNLLSNYGFKVEVNTAIETEREFDGESYNTIYNGPSQHYSNMTSPGGTDYRELRFTTPEIEPSIKGHAQFATKNDIGWARVDERVHTEEIEFDEAPNNERPDEVFPVKHYPTIDGPKTRRILEIQSDYFQKLRNNFKFNGYTYRIEPAQGGNPKTYNQINDSGRFKQLTSQEYSKIFDEFIDAGGDNQFLSLLQRDNQWVTFFVKSLIQDSIKNGYEKVLFPSGDTASKVEGHSTLEQFILDKRVRIKKIENQIERNEYILKTGSRDFTDDNQPVPEDHIYTPTTGFDLIIGLETEIEDGAFEIMTLEGEIEQIQGPEGLAAFAPINFFYENTVKNILNKITTVNEVVDEYGNKWFEVDLNKEVESKVSPVRLKTTAEEVYQEQGLLTMLEEVAADEFENLKQSNGKLSEGFREAYPKLAKFLQDLYNFLFKSFDILQQYVTDKRSLETLYRQIDNNSFGKNFMGERRKSFTELLNQNVAKRVEENSTGANYKITSIPLANISRRVSLVNRDLVNKVLSERDEFKSDDGQVRPLYEVLTKFPNGNDRLAKKEQVAVLQRVYELVKEELDFLTEDLILDKADATNKEEIEELTKAIENTQIVSNLISLEFMTGTKQSFGSEAFDFTKRLIDDLVNSQGVIFKAGTVVTQEKIEKALEEREKEASTSSDDYENTSESSEGREITEEELDSYESWQMNSLAENSFNKISPRLKKEISSIPVMEDEYEEFYDAYGEIVKKKIGQKIKRDDLGAVWYHNAVEIFNTLVDEISSSSNQEVMMEKLAKSRDKHPEIDSVMAKIESYENSRQDGLKKDLFISIGGKYRMSHYVNLSDRVPNPRSQFGEMYDRVRIFNAARQKVEEKIFKKFYSNFNTINWNNQTNTPSEVIGRTSKFEGYTYDKMKILLEVEDDRDQNMNLPDILAAFGFEITNDTRDYLEGNVGNANKSIYANLTYMYNQMVNGINPTNFENETGQGGSVQRIKQISKDLRKADVNVDMKMFLDGKNKLISGHVQAGYAIKLFNDLRENILLNKDQTSKQAALDKFLLENDFAFYRNAPIIKWLEEGRDINLEFGYMDARKRNGAKEGTQITEMGEALMHINKFEYWIGGLRNPPAKNDRKFNYSWERDQFKTSLYNIAVFDSPKTYFLRAPVFESIDDVIDQYERVFNQENKRINALKIRLDFDPNYTTGNKDLDENGLKYQFLPKLNKDMPETWQQAEPKVREALENHFNDYLDILQGYGLIEFSNGEYHATDKMPDLHISGQNLYDSLRMFYYNDSLMTSQTITLLSGDPASYATNKNNKLTSAAYQKRNKQLHANGNYGTFKSNRPNYNVVYFKDVKLESDPDFITNLRGLFNSLKTKEKDKDGNLIPMFSESTIDLIVKGYQQSVDEKTGKVSYPHNTTDAQGYITLDRWKEVLEAYNEWDSKKQAMYDRLSDGAPTADDLFAVSQPLKPHYFGFNNLKDSNGEQEFKTPLQHKYSAIVLHPMLTKDNKTLEKIAQKMKEHQIDEAIFESGIKVGLTKIVTVDEFMESTEDFMSDKVTQASHKYYKQQQKVPEHYQGKVSNLLGIQLRKLLPSNMDLLRVYSTSEDLITLDSVFTGTGVRKKELTGADLLNIVDKLQSKNINEQLDKLINRVITTKEDGTKTTNINNVRNILLDAINDKGLNSNYGNAIEVRSDGRFKLPMSFPTIARKIEEILNSLFKKISKQTHNGGSYVNISSLGFDDELKVRIDPKTGEYYVEVAMPINNKLLGKNVATGEIEKIREGIVYRIPTEEKYSMFPIRVVKWLDPSVGGIIAMPREITSIAGLDFDIDKVYALLYNFEVDKKTGKLEVPRDIVSREGRENLLLDAYTTILSNANAAKDALRFQSVQHLKDIRGEISSKERPIHLSQSQVKFLTRNQAGKNLIGIFANHNSFHALANNRGVMINTPDILEKLLTGSLAKYKGKLSRDLGGIYTQTLGEGNETEISRSFAMLLSAAVDNAKDPILDDLNINVFTAPILGLLLHLGIDMKSAIDRINEPDMIKASRAFSIDGLDEALKDPAVEQLSKTAKSLSKIISALRIDSGTGPTFHDVDKKIDDLMTVTNVEGSGGISTGTLLPKIGFDRTTNEYSIEKDDLYPLVPEAIKSYINVFLQEANFANLDFPYFKTQFKDNKTRLSRFKPPYKSTSAKNRRLADTEHQAILHYGLLVKPDEDVIGFLSEFPARFTTFAANYNAESESKRYSGLFSIFNITGDSTLELTDKNALDNEAVQNIMDQWETALYDEQDPEIKQLANDLIKYGFIMDGYNFTQTSYLHLVPTEFWASTEGFSEFKRIGIAEEHIALFTALNNPSAFIETFYESSFSHTKIEDLQKLIYVTEEGVDYYLPAYAKKNGDQWDIYLNTGYVNSNYTNNSYLEDPTYTKLVWKNPDIQGRTYKIDAFSMEDLNINVKTVVTPNKLVEDKVDANKNLDNMTQNTPFTWARFSKNNYEVSSQGDKRFSALYARLKDGRTIEEAYQLDIKGYRSQGNNWQLGKGKPPLRDITKEQQWEEYKNLWKTYLNENSTLMEDLKEKANGKTLTDKFATTDVSQARALAEILNENIVPAQGMLKEEFTTDEVKDILDQTPDEDPTNTPPC